MDKPAPETRQPETQGEAPRTDVCIVGAGPVGLFAVFECGMLGLSCHVVDSLDAVGGQCQALYPEKPIYDIPGFPRIEAGALVEQLREQASPFEPVYHLGQQVTALAEQADGRFRLTTSAGTAIDAGAVVIAAGAGAFGPNRPPLAGIEPLEGRHVHYLVARRQDFAGQRLVIAGGGDSAVDWVLSLAEIAEKIYVVHRRDRFRAQPENVERMRRLAETDRVELVVPYQLDSLETEGDRLTGVVVATLDGERRRLPADHLLAFFGLAASLGPIAEWGLDIHRHQVTIDPATAATSRPGIHAIGDVTSYPGKLKLILTGFAEAAAAAHAIHPRVRPNEPLKFEYSTTRGVPGRQ